MSTLTEEERGKALELIERAGRGEGRKDVSLVVDYLRTVNEGLSDAIGALQDERAHRGAEVPTPPTAEARLADAVALLEAARFAMIAADIDTETCDQIDAFLAAAPAQPAAPARAEAEVCSTCIVCGFTCGECRAHQSGRV